MAIGSTRCPRHERDAYRDARLTLFGGVDMDHARADVPCPGAPALQCATRPQARTIGLMDDLDALAHGAPASALLLATMLGASLLALYRLPVLFERNLFRPYWFWPRRQFATPVTSAFLHADLAHLLFNAFTFWAFAFGLERQIGTARFLALYAFGLALSSAGTWLTHRHEPGYQTLGASGAILAVLFAAIVYTPSQSIFVLPIPVPIPAPLFALAYLAYTVWASRRGGGRINHDAHLGGAAAGVLFVLLSDAPAAARAWQQVFG
jgi:membrane associated rhomboid family serine protease